MNVAEVLTRCVASCAERAPLSRAAQHWWDHGRGCETVVSAHRRALEDVTDRDLCMAGFTQGRPLRDVPDAIANVRDVVRGTERERAATVERRTAARQVRRTPVVDWIGTVSLADLARASVRGAPAPLGVGGPHRPVGNEHPLAA